jgi:hypothetical protein
MNRSMNANAYSSPRAMDAARRWAWIGLLVSSTVGFSLVFACATPFVALATLAALTLNRRDAVVVVTAIWSANQAVGYGLLNYPTTFDSYAWGVAIGVAALLALAAARAAGAEPGRRGPFLIMGAAFAAAFVAYELALYVASFWLPGSDSAFSWSVISYILVVNALGLGGLLLLQVIGTLVGLETRTATSQAKP